LVFHEPGKNVFYVQIQLKTSEGRCFEYHGPFPGDPHKILDL